MAYILIQNEATNTYEVLFENVKNKFGFNPKLFTMDFQKSSAKAIKNIFPNIYFIKCFFHFIQSLIKNLKKYNLFKNEFKKEIYELLFNLKMLSFINPDNIYNIYKKIKKKFNDKKYIDFFRYFERAWKPNCKYKNIKIIPEWNYYNIINSIEFDVKYLYLTNNIAEHINKLLNSKFQTKYPTFESWKKTIFSVENDINNKTDYIERVNFCSQIIIYFLKWNSENKNNKDLLKYDDIKIMNTLIKPDLI